MAQTQSHSTWAAEPGGGLGSPGSSPQACLRGTSESLWGIFKTTPAQAQTLKILIPQPEVGVGTPPQPEVGAGTPLQPEVGTGISVFKTLSGW